MFNISATLNVSRLLLNPSLCLPHLTVSSFDQLTFPIKFSNFSQANIKGIVLDKDNCFAKDKDDKVWPEYSENWKNLMASYPKEYILIVSNSAGTDDDTGHEEAQLLQKNTGITVLRHSTKKPGCLDEIRDYFSKFGIQSNEIAIIGDRMFTDVLMANMMGAWGIWLSEGVETSQKIFPRIERALYDKLVTQRPDDPFVAPVPKQCN